MPNFEIDFQKPLPPVSICRERCILCEHPVAATTFDSMRASMRAHEEYLYAVKNRLDDVHFEEARLTALLHA